MAIGWVVGCICMRLLVRCSRSALAGVRVKFRPTQQGYVRGVVFEDIVIRNPVAYAVDVMTLTVALKLKPFSSADGARA